MLERLYGCTGALVKLILNSPLDWAGPKRFDPSWDHPMQKLKWAEPTNFQAFSLKTLISAKISVLQPFWAIFRKNGPL